MLNAKIRLMHPRTVLSVGNFFSAGHFFLIVYIIAPYLATFMPQHLTGLVISAGAVITLVAFPFMPHLVARCGAKRLALVLGFSQAVLLSVLALNPAPIFAIALIALISATSPLIAYQLDLLLEATVATEEDTGRVRTLFLTAGNSALILAPLLVGVLLDSSDAYGHVFLAAALSLAPFLALFFIEPLPNSEPPSLSNLRATCSCIIQDTDLTAIAFGNAVLQIFYHLAPIYVPLYLHTVLGMPWSTLGWVFAVMLLPFVFIEYPAGWIADRFLGDKELLAIGFVMTGLSFAVMGFITTSTPIILIVLILLGTRIGAALVESMVETHFFRRVSARDANTVGVFRMTRPLAALIAPVAASIILLFIPYLPFFIVMGATIGILGLGAALSIRDVR